MEMQEVSDSIYKRQGFEKPREELALILNTGDLVALMFSDDVHIQDYARWFYCADITFYLGQISM